MLFSQSIFYYATCRSILVFQDRTWPLGDSKGLWEHVAQRVRAEASNRLRYLYNLYLISYCYYCTNLQKTCMILTTSKTHLPWLYSYLE